MERQSHLVFSPSPERRSTSAALVPTSEALGDDPHFNFDHQTPPGALLSASTIAGALPPDIHPNGPVQRSSDLHPVWACSIPQYTPGPLHVAQRLEPLREPVVVPATPYLPVYQVLPFPVPDVNGGLRVSYTTDSACNPLTTFPHSLTHEIAQGATLPLPSSLMVHLLRYSPTLHTPRRSMTIPCKNHVDGGRLGFHAA
ncbi:hypothetical protein SCLCIDRAFT_12228 [Scleroderma citrinum Foug A]|uniref:Uncharacterized protein n=1 Tax=Scleroderma citrinum Foug A TaxID=1036808 RepID=A0A0C2YMN8_9AGAM|nr:hypothetical protein SCLCIDRAFT_12228 [Scleroderma citrinum Foug A]